MKKRTPVDHHITSDEQLRQWAVGTSLHRHVESKYVKGGECCPDFSCCQPELTASPDERQAFMAATERERTKWLILFLGRAIEAASKRKELNVYICTDNHPEEN